MVTRPYTHNVRCIRGQDQRILKRGWSHALCTNACALPPPGSLLPLFHLRARRKRIFSRVGEKHSRRRCLRRLIWSLIGCTWELKSFSPGTVTERGNRARSRGIRSPDVRSDRETRRFRASDVKIDAKKPRFPLPEVASFPRVRFWRFWCSDIERGMRERAVFYFFFSISGDQLLLKSIETSRAQESTMIDLLRAPNANKDASLLKIQWKPELHRWRSRETFSLFLPFSGITAALKRPVSRSREHAIKSIAVPCAPNRTIVPVLRIISRVRARERTIRNRIGGKKRSTEINSQVDRKREKERDQDADLLQICVDNHRLAKRSPLLATRRD